MLCKNLYILLDKWGTVVYSYVQVYMEIYMAKPEFVQLILMRLEIKIWFTLSEPELS